MRVYRLLLLLTAYLGTESIISVYLGEAIFGRKPPVWYWLLFVLVAALSGLLIQQLTYSHKKEAEMAYKAAYTPKNKYGWYGLIFFVIWLTVYFSYIGYHVFLKRLS